MYKHVCTTAKRIKKATVKFVKNTDWKKVAVVSGAILAGAAITILTGGAGAPIAMALGGAVSGGIISGYDAYKSGKRGWDLAGAVVGGAATGAVTGFIGGQFVGAGASIATNLTKNIGNQAVRQIAKIGVESAVETVIDTGMDLVAGNKVNGQTIAMNFAFNTFTNGAGSVSSKKGAKANTNTGNKALRGEVLDSGYKHSRPIKDVTHGQTGGSQKLLTGPDSKTLRIEAPKNKSSSPLIDISLKFKDGWTDKQRNQALQKVQVLTDADTVKTSVTRKSTSASSRYKKVNGLDSVPRNYDVDHIIDLQLSGADVVDNMKPLDRSVNRSLGSQIHHSIKDYPDGTVFGIFTIKD